jgi:ribonuclease G
MRKEIIINSTSDENRIAITEDGKLAELFIENPQYERLIGDIYLGRIAKVIPGIKAAFIDLGFKQDAFLHFSDIGEQTDEYKEIIGEEDSEIDEEEEEEEKTVSEPTSGGATATYSQTRQIQLPKLERDKKIIVQITKEPVGNKGVRVTSKISLPGRYLVLLPFDPRINASKKIFDLREKRRLKYIVRSYLRSKSYEYGAIVRTVAARQDENAIREDLTNLVNVWKDIEKNIKSEKPPALLYKDLNVTSSVIRDLFRYDVARLITDSKKLYKEIASYLKINSPHLLPKVELYQKPAPIFDVYGIESEIQKMLGKKVELKSGGHIVIEHTEAMVVIDVNSGRYARSADQEQNSLKINLEAVKEIVRQIRLRDLGGIIVIDFIDVYDDRNKRKVYEELRREFRRDRAKSTILPMSEFGVVQITRQRMRQSVFKPITESCPVCGGTGVVESTPNILIRIERWIRRFKSANDDSGKLILRVNPQVFKTLKEGFISRVTRLSFKYFVRIKLVEDQTLAAQEFRFISAKDNSDLTEKFSS